MIAKQRYFSLLAETGNTRATVHQLIKLLCTELAPVGRVTLLTKRVSDKAILENFLNGDRLVKQLGKGVKFPATSVNMVHYYLGNYNPTDTEILVTTGLDSNDLLTIEYGNKNKAVVAISFLAGEVEKWGKITGAISLATGGNVPPFPAPDCLLEQAILNFSRINPSAMLHDSDHDLVKSIFTALKENDNYPYADIVEAYLFRKLQWPKSAITPVLNIMSAVKEGKRIKGKVTRTKEMFKKWKQECD